MIFNKIRDLANVHDWDIGFLYSQSEDCYLNQWDIHYVKHQFRDRWFADPFILDATPETITLLCEEFMYSTKKGRIAKVVVNRHSLEIINFKVVLEQDSHLSFPAYFVENGDVYIYPENSASGCLNLYYYNTKNESLDIRNVLVKAPLTDAVIQKFNDHYYIFSTTSNDHKGSGKTIYIYESDTIDGEYFLYQTIELDDYTARGAGHFFSSGREVIRPAQNCNGGYGLGLVFQKVDFINGKFAIHEVIRRDPPKRFKGMHTYNVNNGIVVLDFYFLRHPFLNKCFWFLRNIIKRKNYG